MRHVATLRTAPPSCIKFGAEPQASQTTQEKPFTFCGPHDTSLTTTEPGGQLMGVTRMHYLDEVNTNDEVIPSDEEISHHWRGKESHSMMPISSLGSYETSKTGRWEPNKSPIIGLEALLREALTLQRLATKITYIKPLHWQHKVNILIFWENTYYFSSLANCFSVLTLVSETLWQAPHRWPLLKDTLVLTRSSICPFRLTGSHFFKYRGTYF